MKYGVFVDCQMASNAMARIAREERLVPIHVYSSYDVFRENLRALNPVLYEHHFMLQGPLQLAVDAKPFVGNTFCVIPGADSALPNCDQIAQAFGVSPENHAYGQYVLDRYVLSKALGIECYSSSDTVPADLSRRWVLKPKVSRGGIDRVSIQSPENLLSIDSRMFASPFYAGNEYSVDMVSDKRGHKLIAIWRYIKKDGNPLWRDRTLLVHPTEEPDLVAKIYDYVSTLLNSSGFKLGATHTEVIVSHDGAVNLVEVNYRTQGQMTLVGLRRALTHDQPTETVRLWTRPPTPWDSLSTYVTTAHLVRKNLFNRRPRRFKDVKWKEISQLPSFTGFFHHFTEYDDLPISDHTLRSMTTKVVLAHEDYTQAELDAVEAERIFHE